MKLIYIAGPFRGPTAWDIAENVRSAERWALEVARLGFVPVCPHAMTAHFHGQCTEQFWVDATLELLRRCDGAIFIPGWEESRGSRGELAECERLGTPNAAVSSLRDLQSFAARMAK